MTDHEKVLQLNFHGRIIDHLGIQMYQSPVAAIAELVANSWDADAEKVEILLPKELGADACLIIKDDGIGMTFDECQDRYLNVGWGRRGDNPNELTNEKQRPVLGRKGIGKFAGFGIASVIKIKTTSKMTGEMTVFKLDIDELRADDYIDTGKQVDVLEYLPPKRTRRTSHGTTVILEGLKINRRPSTEQFRKSMGRRFLLHQRTEDFRIEVDGKPLPEDSELEGIEFTFPEDFTDEEKPTGLLSIENGWGIESLANGRELRWRTVFYKNPIEEDELRGIAIFSKGKLAQRPFFFNLTGGLSGQHGQVYISGQVEADFVDGLEDDIIATERQRINWEHSETIPFEEWGQTRVKELLRIWRDRRGEKRRKEIQEKVAGFSARLEKLQRHEQKTVTQALSSIARIPTLSDDQFKSTGEAILLAWEQGRLHDLIDRISKFDDLSEEDLLQILVEAQVLTALNTAEAVKTKLLTVGGLKVRIRSKDLETAVRDYIAKNPWLISPEWETFRVERSVKKLVDDAAADAKLEGPDWDGRVDLTLSSGNHLLVLEFMRPGIRLDWDHITRFERYVLTVRSYLRANTGGPFQRATGYIVADKLNKDATLLEKIQSLSTRELYALDWETLFGKAAGQWGEFLEVLAGRAPDDERLQVLLDS